MKSCKYIRICKEVKYYRMRHYVIDTVWGRYLADSGAKTPLFALGNTFLAGSGAKTPLFCTWRQVFGRVRCKNTPLLHLGRGVSQSVIPPCYNTGCAEMFAFTEQGVASRSVPYGGPECQCYHYKASSRFG